jgi:hypothetical protein
MSRRPRALRNSAPTCTAITGDVAKEATDMILLDQDLRVLYDGVLEGRRTYGKFIKYIMIGTRSNAVPGVATLALCAFQRHVIRKFGLDRSPKLVLCVPTYGSPRFPPLDCGPGLRYGATRCE